MRERMRNHLSDGSVRNTRGKGGHSIWNNVKMRVFGVFVQKLCVSMGVWKRKKSSEIMGKKEKGER